MWSPSTDPCGDRPRTTLSGAPKGTFTDEVSAITNAGVPGPTKEPNSTSRLSTTPVIGLRRDKSPRTFCASSTRAIAPARLAITVSYAPLAAS